MTAPRPRFKIRLCFLLLSAFFCLAACSSGERTPEKRISEAMAAIYNCPDKKQKELYARQQETDSFDEISAIWEEWMEYNKSRFWEDDFEDGLLDKLVTQWTQNMVFPEMLLLQTGAQTEVKEVQIERSEKNENLTHFSARIALSQNGDLLGEYTVTGNARIKEDGKISEFRILDNKELGIALENLK